MKKFPGKIRKSERRNGVVLCGAYGYGNAGDEAILEAIVARDADLAVERMKYHIGNAMHRALNGEEK